MIKPEIKTDYLLHVSSLFKLIIYIYIWETYPVIVVGGQRNLHVENIDFSARHLIRFLILFLHMCMGEVLEYSGWVKEGSLQYMEQSLHF